LPEDPTPPPTTGAITPRPYHQSKALARLRLAEVLALHPALRPRKPSLPGDVGLPGDFQDVDAVVRPMAGKPAP
jgi:hypothetical protein